LKAVILLKRRKDSSQLRRSVNEKRYHHDGKHVFKS
jgi:hypothetical protein